MVKNMFDSNKGAGGCECSPAVLPYIYGELVESERVEFEAHLEDCDNCAQEISAFSSLRLSIGELKESDPNALTASGASSSETSGGFISGISELIAGSIGVRVLAGAAAAVLLVLIGAAAFTVLFRGNPVPPVAESTDQPSNSRPEGTSDPGTEGVSKPEGLVANADPDGRSVEEGETEKRATGNTSISRANDRRKRPQRSVKAPPREQVAESQEPPRLSEAASEEVEDDSLRLTDLFADISED